MMMVPWWFLRAVEHRLLLEFGRQVGARVAMVDAGGDILHGRPVIAVSVQVLRKQGAATEAQHHGRDRSNPIAYRCGRGPWVCHAGIFV